MAINVALLVGSKKANKIMDRPQMIYPKEINNFLFPNLSLNAPINKVVTVAVTALNAVIKGINVATASTGEV